MTPGTLAALVRSKAAASGVVLATRLPDGMQYVLPDEHAPAALQEAADLALSNDLSQISKVHEESWFLHVQAPPHRLLIVGAVHITQTLAPMASLIGLIVTIMDPRRGFASAERFPGQRLVHGWPDEAMATLKPDRRTAVVALTHDPKIDDPALDLALRGNAFFVGALGSRKTHAARLERLHLQGHSQAALDRIRGPVGLPLGALTPSEIALSVLAEITAVRRGSALAAR